MKNYKTLQGWLLGSCKRSEQDEGDSEGSMIERGVNVTLRVGWGAGTSGGSKVESFVVTSTSAKR